MMGLDWQSWRRKRRRFRGGRSGCVFPPGLRSCLTLADIHPGRRAKVVGFLPGLSSERQSRLQAYGLVPGSWVRVVQHSPVSVIQVENLELALERELACEIQVE